MELYSVILIFSYLIEFEIELDNDPNSFDVLREQIHGLLFLVLEFNFAVAAAATVAALAEFIIQLLDYVRRSADVNSDCNAVAKRINHRGGAWHSTSRMATRTRN